ncbi:MAG: thiamine pyrophosphate-binding protein [Chloroflexi bacterium]|nr:thiamine pyrophosphate-binding protein [Chloroflexota bacterium]
MEPRVPAITEPAGSERLRGTPSRAEFGSDYMAEVIRALGIKYAALNPGSSFRGLHDSLVNFNGNERPEIIECCHEEVAVAIAHGYAKAANEPMVTIAHNVVGLQHATMGIFNAWCDRVPMLVLGGTGPVDAMQRRPWIDWMHTALVQGNLVRDFVKWDDQPAGLAACGEALARGFRVATTEPMGPVYVCFDTELQEMRVDERLLIPELGRLGAPTALGPDPDALVRAADLLVKAERPVIVADLVGRNPGAVSALVGLAEALGAPVLDKGNRFNMPTTHPLDASDFAFEALQDADLVLLLDVRDAYGALTTVDRVTRTSVYVQPPDAQIIVMSVNDLLVRSWTGDYQRMVPTDLSIAADTSIALPLLLALVRGALVKNGAARDRASERGAVWADRTRAARRRWRDEAASATARSPLALPAVAASVWDVIKGEDWVLANGALQGWARRLWDFREPYQYLGTSGGAGLGYGMGASMGAALAARGTNRLVVDLQADGDLLFTASALWTAAHHQLPILTVLHNNRSYYNSEEHAISVARFRERPLENAGIGTRIDDPAVDFATLARAFGLHGEGPITRAEDLEPALKRALRFVKEQGRLSLVDVVCETR